MMRKAESATSQHDKSTARTAQKGLKILGADIEKSVNALLHNISVLPNNSLDEVAQTAVPLCQAIGISTHSLNILLDRSYMGARDALGISRSICEAAVNVAYLLVSEKSVADRAIRHTTQKIHRENNRSSTLANLRLSVEAPIQIKISDQEGVKESLREFTSPSGKEIREWSGKTIDQKIEAISKKLPNCGSSLAASRLIIYGVSSEILHGSPFGAFYFWTALSNEKVDVSARRHMMTHYATAFTSCAFAVDGMILAWKYNDRLDLHWHSNEWAKRFARILKIAFEKADTEAAGVSATFET